MLVHALQPTYMSLSLTFAASVQYADREYWDKRYGEAAGFFDWYHGYDALRELLDAHLSRSCPVLQVALCLCLHTRCTTLL